MNKHIDEDALSVLRQLIDEGLKSGVSDKSVDEIFDEIAEPRPQSVSKHIKD